MRSAAFAWFVLGLGVAAFGQSPSQRPLSAVDGTHSSKHWDESKLLPDLRTGSALHQNDGQPPGHTWPDGLSFEAFTTLYHPVYPKHSVRVKKSKFCDGDVDAYTGYVDVDARHLFFYFFESRSRPDKDDVVFWAQGGPGGSSSLGLFMELGPCSIKHDNTTVYNPYAWNENANLLFIDQPVGVGFSYAEHGETVSTTEEAAVDIAALMSIFFEHFHKLQGRPLHMAGESFAGRYLPLFTAAILDQNKMLVNKGHTPINVASVMMGNGLTEVVNWMTSKYDIQCTSASTIPVQSISTCVRMKQAVPRCEKMVRKSCTDTFDAMDCEAAFNFCEAELWVPYEQGLGRNPYDLTKICKQADNVEEETCYPLMKNLVHYLSHPSIQKELGVDAAKRGNFSVIGFDVTNRFLANVELMRTSEAYVAALLERGVRVLAYVGDYDAIANWVGIERWTRELDWTSGAQFAKTPLRPWTVDGVHAGQVRSYGNFTFATVHGAGHLAPYDKPKESLALVQRWLSQDDI